MDDQPVNYWGLSPWRGLKWAFKHKPIFTTDADGNVHALIHPEDAHLIVDDSPIPEERE